MCSGLKVSFTHTCKYIHCACMLYTRMSVCLCTYVRLMSLIMGEGANKSLQEVDDCNASMASWCWRRQLGEILGTLFTLWYVCQRQNWGNIPARSEIKELYVYREWNRESDREREKELLTCRLLAPPLERSVTTGPARRHQNTAAPSTRAKKWALTWTSSFRYLA